MGFYDLAKEKRTALVEQVNKDILSGIRKKHWAKTVTYFSHEDTYIRKTAYLAIGKIYANIPFLRQQIISIISNFLEEPEFRIRQTAVNAAGEIGIKNFEPVECIFDKALFDEHHSVRNAVIGSVKKMGNKNFGPVLKWAKKYLYHADPEIRRQVCHGIELRGRTYPEDILPMLKELQYDKVPRVRNTLIHVLGQICYKKDCLSKVISHLNTWNNKELIEKAIEEIIDVHDRYKNFAILTQQQAIGYIHKHYKKKST
jgi:HEAT repeat protein